MSGELKELTAAKETIRRMVPEPWKVELGWLFDEPNGPLNLTIHSSFFVSTQINEALLVTGSPERVAAYLNEITTEALSTLHEMVEKAISELPS